MEDVDEYEYDERWEMNHEILNEQHELDEKVHGDDAWIDTQTGEKDDNGEFSSDMVIVCGEKVAVLSGS